MKKKMRALSSLTLAGLLTATMTLPAVAATSTGTGTYGGYTYNWEVECRTTTGMACISVSPAQTAVTAYAQNTLYNELNDIHGKSEKADITSFSSAIVFADNILIDEDCGHRFESTITMTTGWFAIGQQEVVSGVNDFPG